jgi:uncharacterized protein YceK
MRIFLLNLIILLFFEGCNNVRQNKVIKNNLNKIDYKTIYAERDKHKDNCLFMDFWSFMNKQEFIVIRDSLVKTNNLSKKVSEMDTTFWYTLQLEWSHIANTPIIQESRFILIPYFEDGHLLSISLEYKNDEFYRYGYFLILELYKTKYGKPTTIPIGGKKYNYVWIFKKRVIEILPYNGIENGQEIPTFKITYYSSDLYKEKLFQEKKRIDELKTDANNEKAKALNNI